MCIFQVWPGARERPSKMLGAKHPTFLKVFPGPRGRTGPQKPSLSFSLANHDSTVAQITPPKAARGHGGPNRFQNTLLSRLASPQNGPQKAKMNLADLSHRAIVIRSCEESDAFWGRPFAPSLSGELPPPRPPALLGGGGPPGIRRGRQPPRELPPEAQPSRGRKQMIYIYIYTPGWSVDFQSSGATAGPQALGADPVRKAMQVAHKIISPGNQISPGDQFQGAFMDTLPRGPTTYSFKVTRPGIAYIKTYFDLPGCTATLPPRSGLHTAP